MGSFAGHIDEGITFICLALWWLYNMSKNYFKCIEEGKPYRTQMSYPTTIRGRAIHLELILKIGFPTAGFLAECWSNELHFVGDDGNFRRQSSMQHMTIYALFVIHGVSDLIDYLCLTSMHELKYVTIGLAFAWYGGGFYFHSDPSTGKAPLELIIHRLPVTLMFITALVCFVEIYKRDSVVIQMIRCHTVLTFGTWFTYISFVMFKPYPFPGEESNPSWDRNNVSNAHFMVTAFGIHLILNLVIIMAAFYIAESYRKCLKCMSGSKGHLFSNHYEKVKLIDAEDPVFGENEL